MEREAFFSGYCRQTDGARTVMAVAEGAYLTEVDCLYETCTHAQNCPVAQKITDFLQNQV